MPLVLLQLVFVLSWSSGFIGAKLGAETAGAFNLLFWRFLLVTLCLAIVLNRRLGRLTWEKLRYHAVIGFLSQFLYLACVYVAIQHGLPPGIAAIVAALQPLITAAMTALEGSERSGARQWAGLVVGFVGVGIVIGGQYALPAGSVGLVMYLLPLVSALGLSIATIYQRRRALTAARSNEDGLFLPLFVQGCVSLVLFAACGIVTGDLHVPTQPNVWLSVVWLTVFSTFIAYLSLWALLKRMPATRVATLVYLEPPVTLAWAAWMFGDSIAVSTYLGIVVVAIGVWLASKHDERPARARRADMETAGR
ncbi:multidrug DMT transporter permease [Burkholderia sp. MSh2]|uniref:Multidrug DMT transporter permease n=1 Tax=Burkholderia paludis TaxID=1506587 RepID=A0A6P2KF59_9BURK|nr:MULTISPECIES: DMT family transporter [Burkholderia]KEZ04162.1 multidrug DMT transporter permease [Burkholderia sp. MSh2]KFG97100.1 multidrug DMT transporter permease [Burkholderia paludis]CAB3759460.1 putative amino-acid metabolite efflux pump [Burkholderia paludis]VWB55259.1 multidrug DMT transporter permease [Burkholderia paludis]